MNHLLVLIIALLAATSATAQITSCSTPNMTSTFKMTNISVNPAPARGATVTFSLSGVATTTLSTVTLTVTTSLVINGQPIPVDVRTLPCSGVVGCNYPVGAITVTGAQLIPSYTPGGDYSVQGVFSGTNAAGVSVEFGCIVDVFTIT